MKIRLLPVLCLLSISCAHRTSVISPPSAEVIPHRLVQHKDLRTDNYYWLRERENPKVLEYLKKENAYTAQILSPAKNMQEQIYAEMKSRIKENESSAPVTYRDYIYYNRFEVGQQYPLFIRKKQTTPALEEILINGPALAKGHRFFETTGPIVSPNQRIMAYAEDTQGRRFFTIHFKDLSSGKMLSDEIKDVCANMVWAADSENIFYTQQNPVTLRAEKVFRYNLRTRQKKLVYHEKDETFSVQLYKSLSEKFIYINSVSTLTSEVLFAPANQPYSHFKVFQPRERGHEYSVMDGKDHFYILTNKKAQNFKLMTTDLQHTQARYWKNIIPYREDTYLQDVLVFQNHLVLSEHKNGLSQIHITDRNGENSFYIPFPDESYLASVGDNREYTATLLRFEYESMRQPPSTFDLNMISREKSLIKVREVPNFQSNLYKTERIFITARDGQRVPVSLLMRKDFRKDGKAPLLLYGYGAYGINMDPWFNPDVFSLVDRGFVFARAHIRGGADLGREWYEQGRLLRKKNTFYDFIDCTQGLIKDGYASPNRIYAMGGSAGGLLMGAVMNIRPDLYHGIIAEVPFVDVLTTMLDESIPLTTGEYDEWGNPNDKTSYDYIKSYSPYDNVVDARYPNTLVTTGLHDSQVQYWEPAKWVNKLREHNKADSVILLKTDLTSGHGGASGRYEQLKDTATEYSFILMTDKN